MVGNLIFKLFNNKSNIGSEMMRAQILKVAKFLHWKDLVKKIDRSLVSLNPKLIRIKLTGRVNILQYEKKTLLSNDRLKFRDFS